MSKTKKEEIGHIEQAQFVEMFTSIGKTTGNNFESYISETLQAYEDYKHGEEGSEVPEKYKDIPLNWLVIFGFYHATVNVLSMENSIADTFNRIGSGVESIEIGDDYTLDVKGGGKHDVAQAKTKVESIGKLLLGEDFTIEEIENP